MKPLLYCPFFPEELSGDLRKRLQYEQKQSEQKHAELNKVTPSNLQVSLNNISNSLKEINIKNREMQYVENFLSNQPKKVFKIVH